MMLPYGARARARARGVRQHHAHNSVVISRWNPNFMEYSGWEVSACKSARNRCAIVRMMLAYGTHARARGTGASLAPFSFFGAIDASFQIARFQRITEPPPPEPSLCASDVLLMRSSYKASKTAEKSRRTAGGASFKLPSKMSAFPMPSRAPLTRNGGPMMDSWRH